MLDICGWCYTGFQPVQSTPFRWLLCGQIDMRAKASCLRTSTRPTEGQFDPNMIWGKIKQDRTACQDLALLKYNSQRQSAVSRLLARRQPSVCRELAVVKRPALSPPLTSLGQSVTSDQITKPKVHMLLMTTCIPLAPRCTCKSASNVC